MNLIARNALCLSLCLGLTACFSDNGRTYFLDPISGPGYVLNGEHYDALAAVPGVLSVGDRNYEYAVYITFYPTTGEPIASGRFKRNYAPDFGAVESSKSYQDILALMTEACMTDSNVLYKTGIQNQTITPAKHPQGPAYTLAITCATEQIPYNLR